jgi:hypothetical protein
MKRNMENTDLNKKLSEIISSENSNELENQNEETQVSIKFRDGLFEHTELINKKYVTTDGRQLLKEVRFEQ